jgi:DNA-binding winged helix-turn-helix (wHTH) protein/tetratricopeptide (TPR) repeat protein
MGRPEGHRTRSDAGRFRFADFELDAAERELRRRGRRVPIEPKAFDVLACLVARHGRTVPVEALLRSVWRGVSVERGSVHRAVRVLRRLLEADGGARAIETIPRRGYRFALAVHDAGERSRTAAASYVGRSTLCDELDRRLARCVGGRTELVLLHGPAGIGKSATLARLARSASTAGARVFEGRCIEAPGAAPYRPWSRILRAAIREAGAGAVAAELGAEARDLARAMPELGAALGLADEPARTHDRDGRERVHDAFASWIRRRCRNGPLALLFDDLHRADLDSIEAIAFVLRELDGERLLLAVAHRDAAAADATARAIGALASLRPDAPLRIEELTRDEVRDFAEARTGGAFDDAATERLARASGGNPLFVEAILRLHASGGEEARDPGLRGALRRLVEDASPGCAAMLAQACVLGRELDPALVAASLGASRTAVRVAIAEACALRLLEPDDDGAGFRFVHGLIPELLHADLTEAERIQAHRRACDGIVATRRHARDRIGALAHHAREAASAIGVDAAFGHGVAAARDARARLAYDEAIEHFERALALRDGDRPAAAERAACLTEVATLRVLRGDAQAARPRFFEACQIAREVGDSRLFARAALGPSQVEEYAELDHEQIGVLREAARQLGEDDPGLRVEIGIALARTAYYTDPDAMLETTEEALALARVLDDPDLVCRSALARAAALGWCGQIAACRTLIEEAIRIARRAPVSPLVEGAALFQGAREHLAAGDRVGFERKLRRLEVLADVHRLAYFDWSLAALRGTRALLEGRFDDARALLPRQLACGRRASPLLAFQIAAVHETMLDLALTPPEVSADALGRLAERFPEVSPWAAGHAMALAACGHTEAARAAIEALFARDLQPRHRDFLPVVLALLAQAVLRIGDARLAGAIAAELDRVEDRCVVVAESFACHGAVDRYRGLCAEALGDVRAAAAFYERGLGVDAALGALPFVAQGRFDLARALRRRGDPGDAARAAREIAVASDTALRLGMRPLAAGIRAWEGSRGD